MADTIAKVERFSIDVSNKPGEGAKIIAALSAARVSMVALWGYPLGGGTSARVELVPADSAALRAAAKKAKIKIKRECAAFHITGRDRVGALSAALAALADKGINVGAAQAVSSGGKFGCLIEVDAKDVRKAAKALGA